MISQIGPISRIRLIGRISRIGQIGVISIQKAQTSVDYSLTEAFALPTKSNKTTGNLRWYDNTLCLETSIVWI